MPAGDVCSHQKVVIPASDDSFMGGFFLECVCNLHWAVLPEVKQNVLKLLSEHNNSV